MNQVVGIQKRHVKVTGGRDEKKRKKIKFQRNYESFETCVMDHD